MSASLSATRDALALGHYGQRYAELPDDGLMRAVVDAEARERLARVAELEAPHVAPENCPEAWESYLSSVVVKHAAALARVAELEAALRGIAAVGDGSAPDTGHAWEAVFAALAGKAAA